MLMLAAQPRDISQAHPSPEDLAAFSQGALDSPEYGDIVSHLCQCPDCRNELLAVACVASESDERGFDIRPVPADTVAPPENFLPGTPISPEELDLYDPGMMGVMFTGFSQAGVELQDDSCELYQCPWCGARGAAPKPDPGAPQTWFSCDACGCAFKP